MTLGRGRQGSGGIDSEQATLALVFARSQNHAGTTRVHTASDPDGRGGRLREMQRNPPLRIPSTAA